jgi:hypothetical protein
MTITIRRPVAEGIDYARVWPPDPAVITGLGPLAIVIEIFGPPNVLVEILGFVA